MKKISLILVLSMVISVLLIPVSVSAKNNQESDTGTGLSAKYYNTKDLTGNYIDRIDQTIDFNWGYNSPGNNINSDSFSAEWTGQVKPLYSETYTFYTTSDDGVRLWVDGQQIINNWTGHSAKEDSGTITLNAGQKYDIKLQYFDSAEAARISLSWKSNSQAKQVIPQTQLYPKIVSLAGDNPFDYAMFSDNSITFNGSKNYVEGSIHANDSFTANGGLTVTENVEAKSFTLNGKNDFGEKIITSEDIDINKVPSYITEQLKVTDPLNGEQNFHSDKIKLNKSIYINGGATFDAPSFEGVGTIKTTGNIIFNGSAHYNSGNDDVCFYSQNGNIIINGSGSEIYGSLYAPNGSIIFNGSNVKVYGRVIGKSINLNGGISVYYKKNAVSDNFKIVSGDESGNPGVIAVKKDMQGNLIDKEKVIKVVFSTDSEVGKMKINLTADVGYKLPTSVLVKNVDTGETYTAAVDQNGCIMINNTLKKGNYEILITFGITSDIKESAKVGFASKDSIILMDSDGTIVKKYDCQGSVQVRTLAAALSIDAESAKLAVVRGSSTKMVMDFAINSDNTNINEISFDAIGSGTYKAGDITYKITKITRVADNKTVWSGGPLPSSLLKGAYKVELEITFSGNIKDNTKWDFFIKNINITDTISSNVSFGPFNSASSVEVKIVAPPKMH